MEPCLGDTWASAAYCGACPFARCDATIDSKASRSGPSIACHLPLKIDDHLHGMNLKTQISGLCTSQTPNSDVSHMSWWEFRPRNTILTPDPPLSSNCPLSGERPVTVGSEVLMRCCYACHTDCSRSLSLWRENPFTRSFFWQATR